MIRELEARRASLAGSVERFTIDHVGQGRLATCVARRGICLGNEPRDFRFVSVASRRPTCRPIVRNLYLGSSDSCHSGTVYH